MFLQTIFDIHIKHFNQYYSKTNDIQIYQEHDSKFTLNKYIKCYQIHLFLNNRDVFIKYYYIYINIIKKTKNILC